MKVTEYNAIENFSVQDLNECFYVYAIYEVSTKEILYIGKGTRMRAYDYSSRNLKFKEYFLSIKGAVQSNILYMLKDEQAAYQKEYEVVRHIIESGGSLLNTHTFDSISFKYKHKLSDRYYTPKNHSLRKINTILDCDVPGNLEKWKENAKPSTAKANFYIMIIDGEITLGEYTLNNLRLSAIEKYEYVKCNNKNVTPRRRNQNPNRWDDVYVITSQ